MGRGGESILATAPLFRHLENMRDHVHALEHRRVFNIDPVFDEDKVEHPVIVDITMQHDQEFAARISRRVEPESDILIRPGI